MRTKTGKRSGNIWPCPLRLLLLYELLQINNKRPKGIGVIEVEIEK